MSNSGGRTVGACGTGTFAIRNQPMFLPEGGWGRLIAESRAGPAAKGDAMIRQCTDADIGAIDSIINQAANAYRGVIPADCWREPPDAIRSAGGDCLRRVSAEEKDRLLGTYWKITPRQRETSVVLVRTSNVELSYAELSYV